MLGSYLITAGNKQQHNNSTESASTLTQAVSLLGKPEEEATTEDAVLKTAIIIIFMSIFNQKIILCIACLKNVFFCRNSQFLKELLLKVHLLMLLLPMLHLQRLQNKFVWEARAKILMNEV